MLNKTQETLLTLAQAGDRAAENELIRRFEPLHHRIASQSTASTPSAYDDVCQAARQGTARAIQAFTPGSAGLAHLVRLYASGYAQNDRNRKNSALLATTSEEHPRGRSDGHTRYDGLFDGGGDAVIDQFPQDCESPEERVGRTDLAEKVAALLNQSRELDDLDRQLIARRLLVPEADREALESIGASVGLSREKVRRRELRLTEQVLPKVLSALRDSL